MTWKVQLHSKKGNIVSEPPGHTDEITSILLVQTPFWSWVMYNYLHNVKVKIFRFFLQRGIVLNVQCTCCICYYTMYSHPSPLLYTMSSLPLQYLYACTLVCQLLSSPTCTCTLVYQVQYLLPYLYKCTLLHHPLPSHTSMHILVHHVHPAIPVCMFSYNHVLPSLICTHVLLHIMYIEPISVCKYLYTMYCTSWPYLYACTPVYHILLPILVCIYCCYTIYFLLLPVGRYTLVHHVLPSLPV